MTYDKGPQLTVGILKAYFACIPDNVPISVGIGDMTEEAHYLINQSGTLVIHPDCYMQDANEMNLKTIISLQK